MGSAISEADGAPRPSWVGTLGDELGGLVMLGEVELLSCWRGLDGGWA